MAQKRSSKAHTCRPTPLPIKESTWRPGLPAAKGPLTQEREREKTGEPRGAVTLTTPGLGWSFSGSALTSSLTSWSRPRRFRSGTRLCFHLIGNYVVVRRCDWRMCPSITLVPAGLDGCGCNRGGAGHSRGGAEIPRCGAGRDWSGEGEAGFWAQPLRYEEEIQHLPLSFSSRGCNTL